MLGTAGTSPHNRTANAPRLLTQPILLRRQLVAKLAKPCAAVQSQRRLR
jgi:hypothetical protein